MKVRATFPNYQIKEYDLNVASILSGNRNFEGRIHPLVKENFLASPLLCIAFAIVGNIYFDILNEPIGQDRSGNKIFLQDIWPDNAEIHAFMEKFLKKETFVKNYQNIYNHIAEIGVPNGLLYHPKQFHNIFPDLNLYHMNDNIYIKNGDTYEELYVFLKNSLYKKPFEY